MLLFFFCVDALEVCGMALLALIRKSSHWNEQALCSPSVLTFWSHILLAGLTRFILFWSSRTLCSKSCCLSWKFWMGKAVCCGNKVEKVSREFLFALSLRTCCTVIPSCWKCLICTSLLVQSLLCSCWWWWVPAERWQFCVQAALQKANVCGNGLPCFSTKWKKSGFIVV